MLIPNFQADTEDKAVATVVAKVVMEAAVVSPLANTFSLARFKQLGEHQNTDLQTQDIPVVAVATVVVSNMVVAVVGNKCRRAVIFSPTLLALVRYEDKKSQLGLQRKLIVW